MTAMELGRIALRAHIALLRIGVIPAVIAMALLFGAASWIALAVISQQQEQQNNVALPERHSPRESLADNVATPDIVDKQNLGKFYAALGDRAETEQSLKTLFEIAEQTGLSLAQGEYQWQLDRNSGTYRYQILLPVNGPYSVIRQFCAEVLQALPFAALDELSFRREAVDEEALEATLRFTLYLRAPPTNGLAQ